jgi:hypothetical protein
MSPRCSPDQAVGRIAGIGFWELHSQGGDVRGDLQDVDCGTGDDLANRRLDGARAAQPSSLEQPGQFPKTDRSHCAALIRLRSANCPRSCTGELTRSRDQPHQDMGVQKNHFKASQSSGGMSGETMSPRISIRPARQPKMSFGASSAGTSFATGLPRLVIRTGARVVRTLSITCKHRALNSPAPMVFISAPQT